MTQALALAACLPLCIAGFRIRGGAFAGFPWAPGDQLSRLCFAVPAAMTGLAAGLVWWQALVLVPLWWAGETEPLLGSIGLQKPVHYALLALHGVLLAAPAAAALWWFGYCWWALLVAGVCMLPAYVFGRAITWAPRLPNNWLGTAVDFPPRGEAVTGVLLWAGMAAAVLL